MSSSSGVGMVEASVVEGFRSVAIASVADALDRATGRRCYMDHAIKNRTNGARMVGPAVTVLHGPSLETLPPQGALDQLDAAPAGSVVCIGLHGGVDVAVWGGLMSAAARARGLAGAVLDAGVRDLGEIRRDHDLPVFARFVSPGSTVGRVATIAKDVPVAVGGLVVRPGDLVVADEDGVCVVPPEHAAAVLAAARDIDAREADQARLILAERSFAAGMARYGRI